MIRSALLIMCLALVTGGCDSKKKKCEKLADHLEKVAEKSGASNSSKSADIQMCVDDLNDKQIDCMMKADTTSAIIECSKP
jgi:hypothetical protein